MIEFTLSEKIYTLLFRVTRMLRRGSDVDTELPPGQLRMLALISALDVPTQQRVLEFMQIRPASLSEMLSKLEKGGYIVRTRDEKDKRNVVITVTEKGKTVNEKSYDKQKARAVRAFDVLTEEERQQFHTILRKLVLAWEEQENK